MINDYIFGWDDLSSGHEYNSKLSYWFTVLWVSHRKISFTHTQAHTHMSACVRGQMMALK